MKDLHPRTAGDWRSDRVDRDPARRQRVRAGFRGDTDQDRNAGAAQAERCAGEFSYRTILSPGDETLDLSAEEFAYALDLTNWSRKAKGKGTTDRPAGPDIRIARGRRPQRALLLLYPLDPVEAGMADLGMPLIGIVISFPEFPRAKSLTYKYNSVERRLELQ